MGWLTLVIGMMMVMLFAQAVLFWKMYQSQRHQYQMERENWERERERLLNRAMTKEWASYVQMTQALTPSISSEEPPLPSKGMSDEEELRRFMGAVEGEGLGEVVFDMTDDLKELGIIQE